MREADDQKRGAERSRGLVEAAMEREENNDAKKPVGEGGGYNERQDKILVDPYSGGKRGARKKEVESIEIRAADPRWRRMPGVKPGQKM
jgi:hypothetical protein